MAAKNIFAALQQSRADAVGEVVKGTQGYGYDYVSGDDILPVANEIFNRNGLCPIFNIKKKFKDGKVTIVNTADTETETREQGEFEYWGVLDVFFIEDPKQVITIELPTCLANVKGASAVQNYGGMASFVKRYCYLALLEVGVPKNKDLKGLKDSDIEKYSDEEKKAEEPKTEKKGNKVPKATKEQVELINGRLEEGDLPEILKMYSVDKLENLTVVQASDCLKRLG